MHSFNRLLVVLLAVALLVAAVGVLLVTFGAAQPADLAPAPWFADRLAPYARLDLAAWRWTVGVGLVLVLASVLLIAAEVRPGRREAPRLTLKQDGLGTVTVTRSGVRQIIEWEAGRVAGVAAARSELQEGEDGLHVVCRVSVDPAADIAALTEAVQERVRAALAHAVGRPVAEVRVDAQVARRAAERRLVRRVR